MLETSALILLAVAVIGMTAWYFLPRPAQPSLFENEREERLTRAMARIVGCSLKQALPAVRKELDIAPGQTDDTLIKRAAYHYRQDQPVAECPIYPEKRRG
ncbi:MAG: hypothetical protein HYX68_19855 [Planctomycetes bacterium]|jgi:hypothetical protein|nr:hypothetical protein [Planctomycetota bacterium]